MHRRLLLHLSKWSHYSVSFVWKVTRTSPCSRPDRLNICWSCYSPENRTSYLVDEQRDKFIIFWKTIVHALWSRERRTGALRCHSLIRNIHHRPSLWTINCDAFNFTCALFHASQETSRACSSIFSIQIGDQIIEVDDHSLVGVTHTYATNVLKATSGSVR